MKHFTTYFALGAFAALSACNSQSGETPAEDTPIPAESAAPSGEAADGDESQAPVSILRPEIEQPAAPALPLEPVTITIGFPEGGNTLGASAIAALEELLTTDQVTSGGQITLRAHSDTEGSDAANMRSSRARGDKVRDWMIDKGIDKSRITVIAFGEQNPAQPNAMPDGSPNKAGRAANRRVEIEVAAIAVNSPVIAPAPTSD
ncbi:OmpA family protein [Erythrobacter insulae]|uniref:OmpA family protein n=1 Tax=Erythrobacter insulae TaxID=2584124 RepID=A0A547PBE5_9SPHN|nr:OmpA family protein [Erythrobacter insulae]TRD11468.1 OmpA family protein [Erythrobacter insulae]